MTSLLKSLSEESGVPLSTLKLNARILREFRLIHYGNPKKIKEASLSPLGAFVHRLLNGEAEGSTVTISY